MQLNVFCLRYKTRDIETPKVIVCEYKDCYGTTNTYCDFNGGLQQKAMEYSTKYSVAQFNQTGIIAV